MSSKAASTAERAKDHTVQQLRGVFAAFDENRDNYLTQEELAASLLSLGLEPTPALLQTFQRASGAQDVDQSDFVRVCMESISDDVRTTAGPILELLKEFDPSGSGAVNAGVLKHLLAGVSTPSKLSVEETSDFLRMLGVVGPSEGAFSAQEALAVTRRLRPAEGALVDYGALLRQMVFHPGKAARGQGAAPVLQQAAARMANGARLRRRRGRAAGGPADAGTAGTAGPTGTTGPTGPAGPDRIQAPAVVPRPPVGPAPSTSPGAGSGPVGAASGAAGEAVQSSAAGAEAEAVAARARAAVDAAVRRGEQALLGGGAGGGVFGAMGASRGGRGPTREAPGVVPPGVPLGAQHGVSVGERLHGGAGGGPRAAAPSIADITGAEAGPPGGSFAPQVPGEGSGGEGAGGRQRSIPRPPAQHVEPPSPEREGGAPSGGKGSASGVVRQGSFAPAD